MLISLKIPSQKHPECLTKLSGHPVGTLKINHHRDAWVVVYAKLPTQFPLRSRSQGLEINPCVRLRAQEGVCLKILSAPPPTHACVLSLQKNLKKNDPLPQYHPQEAGS